MSSPGIKSVAERLIKPMVKGGGPTDGGMVLLLNWHGLCSLLDGFMSTLSMLSRWDQAQQERKGHRKWGVFSWVREGRLWEGLMSNRAGTREGTDCVTEPGKGGAGSPPFHGSKPLGQLS